MLKINDLSLDKLRGSSDILPSKAKAQVLLEKLFNGEIDNSTFNAGIELLRQDNKHKGAPDGYADVTTNGLCYDKLRGSYDKSIFVDRFFSIFLAKIH
ncbi:unnamed protein product, partial [marine sediment metagenome]